jgi:hypothetical protein
MTPSMVCPKCSAQIPEESRFCLSCGQPVSSLSQAPTAAAESPAAQMAPAPVGRLISSDSLPVGGFTPGMVLADRYRVIGLIGRGGMGEVYRADDLKLGQPVALKFLPKALADDPVRRERLFAEVRIARQVSHPNICRVYDIGEIDGRPFLTMEYIDGEDLASLLKRIGSLHGTKALDVARQLCAGLAAAHDKGVLHRDLKPANVMLDGRGRVRITDFGLAVAAGEEASAEDVSGTPPYMAPEQFAGKGASVRSDIYALGLIFYELFTGRRAFEEKTLAELRAKKETSSPTAPSEMARDIDPIIERVILRCIEKDPRQRPSSAAQIAAALPGGDPLAAAIAAGETPSPEMLAASGSTEGLKPWIAWACLAFIILGIGRFGLFSQRKLVQLVQKPPDVMAERARDILKVIGYSELATDSAFRFVANNSYFQKVAKIDRSPTRFKKLPALAVQFWYRQSSKRLAHSASSEGITPTDPPLLDNGESIVWLDSRGHLTGLQVIPQGSMQLPGTTQAPDWSTLFKAAGLDQTKYNSVQPDLSPLSYADVRAAWIGTLPDFPNIPIRIEAASWQGKPVLWRLIAPVYDEPLNSKTSASVSQTISNTASLSIAVCVVLAGSFFARRNLRMGKGDRRGATHLACLFLILAAIRFIFTDHFGSVFFPITSGVIWVMYIALEPYVRRRWPGMLAGWNRLLLGNIRDPLLGRDLLVGCAAGVSLALVSYLAGFLNSWFHFLPGMPMDGGPVTVGTLYLLSGARAFVAAVFSLMCTCLANTLLMPYLLFLFRVLFRKTWIAAILFIVITSVSFSTIGESTVQISLVLAAVVHVFVIFRFGILAWMVEQLFYNLLCLFPITMDLSAWYSGIGLTGLAILLALALYAFYASLGSRPMFGRASLED